GIGDDGDVRCDDAGVLDLGDGFLAGGGERLAKAGVGGGFDGVGGSDEILRNLPGAVAGGVSIVAAAHDRTRPGVPVNSTGSLVGVPGLDPCVVWLRIVFGGDALREFGRGGAWDLAGYGCDCGVVICWRLRGNDNVLHAAAVAGSAVDLGVGGCGCGGDGRDCFCESDDGDVLCLDERAAQDGCSVANSFLGGWRDVGPGPGRPGLLAEP